MEYLPKLDVVIVNWNSGAQLRECLQALEACCRKRFRMDRVVVVDNGSRDGSAEGCHFPGLPLQIVRNGWNAGFAAACNLGAAGSTADYILFLNPDTRVFPDALDLSCGFMEREENARVGITGVQLVEADGSVARTCARFPTLTTFAVEIAGLNRISARFFPGHFLRDWDHAGTRRVDQVMGAFFLVRRRLFEALRGFDERFFVYFEEVDFSLRAAKSGWQSWYLAEARCFHRGCGTTDQIRAERLFYSLRSRLRFAGKNMSRVSAAGLTAITLLVEPATRIAFQGARGSWKGIKETFRAYALLLREGWRIHTEEAAVGVGSRTKLDY